MSAITGIYQWNHEPIPQQHGFELMKALEKFPADDIRIWHRDPIFLGCHSQWITPESLGELLPYYDPIRQFVITADAIIDNREELFEKLNIEYPLRKSVGDSELILLAYERWGEESPKYLVGEFAYVIWDEKKQQLFGARDFSGSRTLYYHQNQDRFAFCTTIEPLFSLPEVHRRLNEDWIAEYLANPWRTETIEVASTVYSCINQVPAAHSLTVKENKVSLIRYCRITPTESLRLKSDEEYEEAFLDVLQRAVKAHTRSYRNVGAFLSGGLDSGTIASMAARRLHLESKELYSYSYVPPSDFIDWTNKNKAADERPYIRSLVQHVGNIREHYLDFEGKSALSEVDDWLEMVEMPYKSYGNSFWLRGIYEQAHEQGVKVLLNGARGNSTISWGPAVDYYALLFKKLRWIRLYKELNSYSQNIGVGRRRIAKAISRKVFPSMHWISPLRDQREFPSFINPEFAERTGVLHKLQSHHIDLAGFAKSNSNLYKIRKDHFEQPYMWSMSGTLGTKMSLRYSLWSRDPSNDLRVIRFCLSVPENQFVQKGLDRALIRRATKDLVPDEVRLNQRIRGIQGADGVHRILPLWESFGEELQQLTKDPAISEYLNIPLIKAEIQKLLDHPSAEKVFSFHYIIAMRSLILYRFLKKNRTLEGR